MKKKYIIGNWKSHKTMSEVEGWFRESSELWEKEKDNIRDIHLILCPPFLYLQRASELVKKYNLPIELGAQNISPFDFGAYTGEVAASQVKDFANYVIIGHSERRNYFKEDDTLLFQKVKQALEAKLIPIYCVPDETTPIPSGVSFVAYEPISAIGTGNAQDPLKVNTLLSKIRERAHVSICIYGGSVTAENIKNFFICSEIDGVLPGGASLTPSLFWGMIRNV